MTTHRDITLGMKVFMDITALVPRVDSLQALPPVEKVDPRKPIKVTAKRRNCDMDDAIAGAGIHWMNTSTTTSSGKVEDLLAMLELLRRSGGSHIF